MARVKTPSQTFWQDELELDVEPLLRDVEATGFGDWVASRTGRQLRVLCRVLNLVDDESRIKDLRAAATSCDGKLVPFFLTDHFARRKGRFAVADLAVSVLDPAILELCRVNDEAFDTNALLYALLHNDPENLKKLFHLDKIHKSGFARMALKQKIRQPRGTFEEYLQPFEARRVLEAFDKAKRDQRQSQLKNIVRHSHHHLVFIRRPERPQHIMRDGRIHHGHRAEWIILDFADNARRVNIASDSNEVPLQISNALASAYFGRDVQYDNECEITYEKQIHNLLDALKAGTCDGLKICDIEIEGSPLHGVDLRLGHDNPDAVVRAIAALERDTSSVTARIDRITKLKVIHLAKRIDIRFERLDTGPDEFIVRYMDHRLNATIRKQFEDFMRETHGIPILSTEKRFARRA